ncbi:MAG: hypothetical protein IJ809_07300 [Clostridia bacterium]|nr:hypothetical protein [Clostridia bacterium]
MQICGKFNPQWKTGDGTIDASNENVASYLCYHGAWTSYLDSSVASYAIGSPSVEMYIDAWNQYKGSKLLDYKWVASGTSLYASSGTASAGANGYAFAPGGGGTSIIEFGKGTAIGSLTTEANSMFIKSNTTLWMASPACSYSNSLCWAHR